MGLGIKGQAFADNVTCIAISATIYAERSGSVGVIISVLFSVMGALMVETPQSVPTAPSMHRHTMRVVLVIDG